MTNTANDRPQEWYDARADHLAEFLTDERRRTLATALAERTRYMTLLAENTFHPHNASALMRHCDAFGVQELHTVETLCKFSPNASIVRGTDKWVDVRRHASTGEAVAAKYYQQRGWLLLNHNYRTRLGELDLILYKENTLVFAEVKTRTGAMLDRPAAAVDARKQNRLILAAQQYLQHSPYRDVAIRFDVVEVTPAARGWQVHCIPGAFEC